MMPKTSEQIRLQTGIQIFYLIWTLLLAVWLFDYSIMGCELASWDDYERCAWASTIWYDIRYLDLFHFWRHTNEQVVWPPLHSWVTGILFIIFGASLETARLVCLSSLWISALFMFRYFVPYSVGGMFAAVVSWMLLTSSSFMVHHATSVMSEMPGLCLIFAVVVFIPKNDKENSSFIVPGVLLGLLFLYKYNFAGITFAALLLSRWLESGFAVRAFFTKANLQLFGIPLFMFIVWMIPNMDDKISGFAYFAANNPNARTPLSWASIVMYPKQLPTTFFMAPWVCYVSGGLMLLAFAFQPKRFITNPVFTLLWLHFLAAVLHPMKDIRFVFIPMGLWYLMTGISLQWVIQRFAWLQSMPSKVILSIGLITLTMMAAISQKELYQSPQLAMESRHKDVVRFITDYVEYDDFAGLLISHDLFMPPAINFYFTTMMDTLPRRSYKEPQRWSFFFLLQPRESVLHQNEEERIKALRHELFVRRTNKIIVLKSTAPEKIVNFETWYGGADEMRGVLEKMPEVHLSFEKRYDEINLLLKIYHIQ